MVVVVRVSSAVRKVICPEIVPRAAAEAVAVVVVRVSNVGRKDTCQEIVPNPVAVVAAAVVPVSSVAKKDICLEIVQSLAAAVVVVLVHASSVVRKDTCLEIVLTPVLVTEVAEAAEAVEVQTCCHIWYSCTLQVVSSFAVEYIVTSARRYSDQMSLLTSYM